MKDSKLILVNASSGTSFDVHVFGTSNSRTVVYNGTDQYVNGCLFRCKLADEATVALSALSNVGVLGLGMRGRAMATIAMSVKRPSRVKVVSFDSACSCISAGMSVKGPRLMAFIRSVGKVSLRGVNPRLRGGPLFPSHAGMRFTRMLSSRGVEVHI